MSQGGDFNQGTARPRPGTRSIWARVFRWAAAALAAILVAASLGAYLKFRSVWTSIARVPVANLGPQPRKFTSAMNILVIGSDSRAGPNRRFGAHVSGQRSDTIIILHLAAHGRGIVALSIPRDSVVPVLSCPPSAGAPGQTVQPGQVEQINATFAAGGPACLWKTIEQTTHLHLDHFIELTFTGFEKVINDVGGVSICLPFGISDPLSGLHLSKGRHHVGGREALAFWRARYIGEGSDLQRIRRDQYLLAAILQAAERSNPGPSRLLAVITDAARSMTTDTGLTLPVMMSILTSVRHLNPRSVQFVELPTVPYAPDPNWVSWPAGDAALFRALAHDQRVRPALRAARHQRPPAMAGGPATRPTATAPAATPSPSGSPHPPGNLTKTYGGITGNTNICNDGPAFAGPRGGSLAIAACARAHGHSPQPLDVATNAPLVAGRLCRASSGLLDGT